MSCATITGRVENPGQKSLEGCVVVIYVQNSSPVNEWRRQKEKRKTRRSGTALGFFSCKEESSGSWQPTGAQPALIGRLFVPVFGYLKKCQGRTMRGGWIGSRMMVWIYVSPPDRFVPLGRRLCSGVIGSGADTQKQLAPTAELADWLTGWRMLNVIRRFDQGPPHSTIRKGWNLEDLDLGLVEQESGCILPWNC